MNFLAHLWLTERAGLPLAGAVLGDILRGRLDGRLPPLLERSIALHRRIDVVTDAHPQVVLARAGFGNGQRRYAGIVLDMLHDHALAQAWPEQPEALDAFALRAARAVVDPGAWQLAANRPAPDAARFAALLRSYREEAGIDDALARISTRLSKPHLLLDAAAGWRSRMPTIRAEHPLLMADLEAAALAFAAGTPQGGV
ncbi:MAG: ACP phosphodiesterase [Nevskia sp.]|nr:ACP phosphodiesterase [Nevskia sp.]